MLKDFFQKQKQYLSHFFDTFDLSVAERILQVLVSCKGSFIFCGVGKSGIIAKKLATTFLSTGTKAFYLSPLDALHGDLGMVDKEDLFFFLSKSGKTQELLHLIPYIRKKKAKIISFICEKDSPLEKQSDISAILPLAQEACPYGMVPTTSSLLQLILGDSLAVALMEKKQFSLKDYALNHPGGTIGKRVIKKVKDLMLPFSATPIVKEEDTLQQCLAEFSEKRCGCLIVVDDKFSLRGIFTDGDLRRALQKQGTNLLFSKIKDLMTPSPRYAQPEHLAFFALQQMENSSHPITVLPVVRESKVIGILRMHDVLQEGLR